MSNEILTLPDGYDRTKNPRTLRVVAITPAELVASIRSNFPGYSDLISLFVAKDGTVRRLRQSGRIKLWKRSPERVEVPCKYGLYESATFIAHNGRMIAPTMPEVFLVREVERR